MILVRRIIQDRFGLRDRETGIILRCREDGLELGLGKLVFPVFPEAGAADE